MKVSEIYKLENKNYFNVFNEKNKKLLGIFQITDEELLKTFNTNHNQNTRLKFLQVNS